MLSIQNAAKTLATAVNIIRCRPHADNRQQTDTAADTLPEFKGRCIASPASGSQGFVLEMFLRSTCR